MSLPEDRYWWELMPETEKARLRYWWPNATGDERIDFLKQQHARYGHLEPDYERETYIRWAKTIGGIVAFFVILNLINDATNGCEWLHIVDSYGEHGLLCR